MANKLMAPGPVPIHPKILDKFSQPIIHHRTPEFSSVLSQTLAQLKEVFCTEQPVMIIPGTGSAAMEASIVNTLSAGDQVLVLINGKFGQRWADMATNYGLLVDTHKSRWGCAVDLQELEQKLKSKTYRAVLCQGVETSTGTINPIKDIGHLIKSYSTETLFLVDGITAMGLTDINMSIPSIDILIAGSQKAFMLPTGMSFITLSPLAWDKAKTSNLPKYYFDLLAERTSNEKNQTRFSSLVSHIIALNFALNEFCNEKRTARIEYTKHSSYHFKTALQKLGLKLLSENPAPTLTAFLVPDHVDGLSLRKRIESQYGITVMGGQDQLKGKIIRVGHMGYIRKSDYIETLQALYQALADEGHTIDQSLFQDTLNQFESQFKKDYHDYFAY